jgi:hypothetical protein
LLLEGNRKAVKAALVEGVKPTQAARHFGLSPAEFGRSRLKELRTSSLDRR